MKNGNADTITRIDRSTSIDIFQAAMDPLRLWLFIEGTFTLCTKVQQHSENNRGAIPMTEMIKLIPAATVEQIEVIRELFTEYQRWLNFSLCFQGFDEELAALPGKYAPPLGRLYIAECGGKTAGCIALRPMDEPGICEMKRLYVRDEFRGQGIGKYLTKTILADAKEIGYTAMRLDTLQRMETARSLYRNLGFNIIPAYYHNPLDEVVYMELPL